MKRSIVKMGTFVQVEIADSKAKKKDINQVFSYLDVIDERFSTYKSYSEIQKINRGELALEHASEEVRYMLDLAQKTKKETHGYFDIYSNGLLDPSGIVKGYAIYKASQILLNKGYKNFYVDIGGDIQLYGKNKHKKPWKVGVRNPFNTKEIVKILHLSNKGVATSGTYERGNHIYNPIEKSSASEIASITVVGPNVYEADRFATASFAMGYKALDFVEKLEGCEAYLITHHKKAYWTSGFLKYA